MRPIVLFNKSENGAVAIIFAFTLVILAGFAAIAIDYSRGLAARNKVQIALDASTLSGSVQLVKSQQAAKAAAEAMFASYQAKWPDIKVSVKFDVSQFQVAASSSFSIPTTFGSALGFKNLPIAVTSSAGSTFDPIDIHFAVDMSASMEIGATKADRTALMALTKPYLRGGYIGLDPNGCAFACHHRHPDIVNVPGRKTLYDLARNKGIKIRGDIVEQSVEDMLTDLLASSDSSNLRASIFGFSGNSQLLVSPTPKSFDVSKAFGKFPASKRDRTHLDQVLPAIDQETKRLSENRTRIIVLVTDGLHDRYGGSVNAIDTSLCSDIKRGGAQLVVVEIKYEDLSDISGNFRVYAGHAYPYITPNLKKCASPGMYFLASDPTSIHNAMNKVKDLIKTKSLALKR
jgi:Flp pilus assembly protein TadG